MGMTSPAARYFADYDYESWPPPAVRREWVKTWVKSGDFLDIGCGAVPVTMDIEDGKARGTGLDVSPLALRESQKYFKEFHLLDLDTANKKDLIPFFGRFDTVIMSETLEHFENPEAILKKVKSFMATNARLIITFPNMWSIAQRLDPARFIVFNRSHVFRPKKKELENLFKQFGFKIIHFDYRPSDIIEGFPKENNTPWRVITKLRPSLFAHQFLFVLK